MDTDIARRRGPGDRKDGRRLRSLDPFYTFTPFVMQTRGDSVNYFSSTFIIDEAEKYIRQKRDSGYKGFGLLHLFIAGYIRTVAKYPAMNRFVAGKRIYARYNIEVNMAIKKSMSTDGGETTFKVAFQPTDTVEEVYRRMNEEIDKIKNDTEESGTDKWARRIGRLPRPIFSAAMKLIGWLDYHGWLPLDLTNASPFHGSLVITDLGSIGIEPVYHHLYNFGTVPLFLAFGMKRKLYELTKDGTVEEHKVVDYRISCDERICDGYYYATGIKYMLYLMRHPQQLDLPPESVTEDVE